MKKSRAMEKTKVSQEKGPVFGPFSPQASGKRQTVFPLVLTLLLLFSGLLIVTPGALQPAARSKKIVEKLIPIAEDNSFHFGQDENYIFNSPARLEVAGSNIYVLDSLDDRLRIFDLGGKFVGSIGQRGKGPVEFNHPQGLFVDPVKEKIYIADTRNLRVQIMNLQGKEASMLQLTFPPLAVTVLKDKLLVAAFPGQAMIMKEEPLIRIYNSDFKEIGAFLKPVKASDTSVNLLANQFVMKKDRLGQLVCARQFCLNEIQIYDADGHLNHRFDILYKAANLASPGIDVTIKNDLDVQKIAYFVADVAFDSRNNYYFLAGNTGLKSDGLPERGREIYKYNSQGEYLGTILLPEKAVLISFGADDSLYLLDSNFTLRRFKIG
ncbi:MAG TPA: 6-bladed beta-propeller [Candidatus Saccharicenans sp.]|nr:6-bladed beta-propeller [Candidatus Saccharicenans sp.]